MIELTTYVLILLCISAVATGFIVAVIIRQLQLFKYGIANKRIRRFRVVLFLLSVTIVLFGMIPTTINVYSLFSETERPKVIRPISFVYSIGVHTQALVLSYLIWRLYRLADDTKEITDLTEKRLTEDNQRNRKE